ncbi:hypothetical protein EYF80_042987 [Liparis tanakae]|uniref:Uncharacterized protein n=1 Tax=Liparis tanakae TaxID=230148 RepID=A0A4Z2G008_9TELE|nr:hypothetical protein EYF80_042987 [Liparis tanakae]
MFKALRLPAGLSSTRRQREASSVDGARRSNRAKRQRDALDSRLFVLLLPAFITPTLFISSLLFDFTPARLLCAWRASIMTVHFCTAAQSNWKK